MYTYIYLDNIESTNLKYNESKHWNIEKIRNPKLGFLQTKLCFIKSAPNIPSVLIRFFSSFSAALPFARRNRLHDFKFIAIMLSGYLSKYVSRASCEMS